MGEFDLIRRYCRPAVRHTVLAGGDDAALLAPAAGMELAVSHDLLVAGRHYFETMDPERLARKAVAVNLSDMAAMAAVPRWVLLGLVLPRFDEAWVAAFCRGFESALTEANVDWVGGDTTAGPAALAVTVLGEVPRGKALRRSGARPEDDIWVSGTLGDAALGLGCLQGTCFLEATAERLALSRFEQPAARLDLGYGLRDLAHAAIDISDGLLGDLDHVLTASGVGAVVQLGALPVAPFQPGDGHDPAWRQRVLAGGEDYELCFTAAPHRRAAIETLGQSLSLPLTRIGMVTGHAAERRIVGLDGGDVLMPWRGFDHFPTP